MKYRSREDFFERSFKERFVCSSGDEYRVELCPERDERGNFRFVEGRKINIVKEIQAASQGTDVHEIVARYQTTGDSRILSFDPSVFGGDSVGVPRDMRSVLDVVKSAEKVYANLSPEVARQYPTFSSFLGDVSKIDFGRSMKKGVKIERPNKKESEVNDNVAEKHE